MKNKNSQQPTLSPSKKILFSALFFFFVLLTMELILSFARLDQYDREFMPKSSYPIYVKGKGEPDGSFVSNPHFEEFINWQSFQQKKDADTYRIFVIGGSAAYAWPNIEKFGFTGYLRRAFEIVTPGKFEIINGAGLSYGSHRVLDVLQDVLLHKPDLVIVFSGNNEYVERNVLPETNKTSQALDKIGGPLGQLNIYRAVRLGLYKTFPDTFSSPKKPDITDIRSEPGFERGSLGRTTEIDQEVLNNYRANLSAIKEHLIANQVSGIFCTIPVNFGGWIPKVGDPKFASENDANTWLELYELKEKAFRSGNLNLESKYLKKMLALTPDDPGMRFNYGKVLWNLKKYKDSYQELVKAKDLDMRPIRALSSFNETIRTLANEGQGIYLADLENNFREIYLNKMAEEFFLDYCHFTDLGHKTVARMLLPVIQKSIGKDLPLKKLGSKIMADTTSHSKDKTQRAAELFAKALTLQNNQRLDETIKALEKVLNELPGYNSALTNLGTIYFKKGDYGKANDLYLKAIEVSPKNIDALTSLGYISLNNNKLEQAKHYFQKSYTINPYAPSATLGLAYVAKQKGNPADAKLYYEKTLQLGRDSFTLRHGLGEAYLMLGDKQNAIHHWKNALKFKPFDQGTKELLEKFSKEN